MNILEKPATTTLPIHPLLQSRWSPRAFASQSLPREQILRLLEAARWSPSGGNEQPWSFIVVTRDEGEVFAKTVGALNEGNRVWAQQAPLLVIAVARLVRGDANQPNAWATYDLGQAVAHLTVQASAEGLAVHQMGGFSADALRELFAIPEEYAPMTAIAIGMIGDPESLPEQLRERERAERTRKPLAAITFGEHWGQPAAVLAGEKR